jgi:hypothetical protein
MSLELQDLGRVRTEIRLPTDGVIRGDLAVLRQLGRKPASAPGSTTGSGAGGSG